MGLSRLIPPPLSLAGSGLRAREGGGCLWGCLHEQPCFEKVVVLSLQAEVLQLEVIEHQSIELYQNACLLALLFLTFVIVKQSSEPHPFIYLCVGWPHVPPP